MSCGLYWVWLIRGKILPSCPPAIRPSGRRAGGRLKLQRKEKQEQMAKDLWRKHSLQEDKNSVKLKTVNI